ncbi:AAA domain protein [Leptospira santarosai str. CBC379]|uniref:ATP-dependent nuclease n=1 Tax=Leptospira santarosai TaxID=28183 RepID=UPI0002489519|nr:ATP-binding protein [Leptospira santarosai]EKR92261.1 AAA domain protein [Leptospira santarosai str. CBC379]EMM76235.1 AAA domain protein [Leptospira santarosai str. 2000030832]
MNSKITKIKLKGLPGYEDSFELEFNDHLTSLIGPNGSGKTTSLSAIHTLFDFLNKGKFEKRDISIDNWLNWDEANIELKFPEPFKNTSNSFLYLGEYFDEITISLKNTNKEIFVSTLSTINGLIGINDLGKLYLRSEQLETLSIKLSELRSNEQRHSTELSAAQIQGSSNATQNAQSRLDSVRKEIKIIEEQINKENIDLLNFNESGIRREAFENFLRDLSIPRSKYIRFGETDFSDVADTIKNISKIRGGKDPEERYSEIKRKLRDLLQQDPHFYYDRDNGNQDYLEINNVDYQKVSTGTKICLFYFSLIFETKKNDLIIWDEPENGLHPTRRYKVLDLILSDTRQFLIATHSTEMAPVFSQNCNVIRTICEHRDIDGKNYLSLEKTMDKIGAFQLADSLGLSPSRILFTSNVVIWVEGPSDMIFWRKAISLHEKGISLVEGFDYSFLMYGGKCISHLTAMETNQKLDITSICRHPIFIVDSDIDEISKYEKPSENLKESAKAVMDLFSNPKNPPGTNLFLYSNGREMENYIPVNCIKDALTELVSGIEKSEIARLNLDENDWSVDEKYYEMLDRKFIASNLVVTTKSGEKRGKGFTKWGEKNKTEFVKFCIESNNFKPYNFRHNGSNQVTQIVEFVERWKA